MSTIQVRVDDDLKSKADALFKELGTDTTSAIRMFLTQAVAYDGIPFEIKKFNKTKEMKIMTEDEFLDRLVFQYPLSFKTITISVVKSSLKFIPPIRTYF